MRWWILVAAGAVGVALWPQPARAQTPTYSLTPDGPATLNAVYRGPVPAIGIVGVYHLTAWRAEVGPGGSAGTVRPRIATRSGAVVLGDPVTLPAEPGTYTFPTAPVEFGTVVGIEQTTGGHALIRSRPCQPDAQEYADWCRIAWVDISPGEPQGMPTTRLPGADLAISASYIPAPRPGTDLRVRARSSRDVGGRLRIAVTTTNAGAAAASYPGISALIPRGFEAEWEGVCDNYHYIGPIWVGLDLDRKDCGLAALAPGASQTVTLVTDPQAATKIIFATKAEIAEVSGADNSTEFTAAPLPSYTVNATRRQHLANALRVRVRAARPGPARVTATLKVHGRSVRLSRTLDLPAARTVTVTLRPRGAALRSLRRAVRQRAIPGTVTIRPFDGPVAATAPVTLRREG